jgi:hypothetical protein
MDTIGMQQGITWIRLGCNKGLHGYDWDATGTAWIPIGMQQDYTIPIGMQQGLHDTD